jgi:histidinol-phosphate aminotransferase
VRKDREVLAGGLHALGFSVAASQTNFLLAKAPEGAVAESLYLSLKASGILVRYFATPRLRDSLRITVGTPEQNAQLLEQLKILLKN